MPQIKGSYATCIASATVNHQAISSGTSSTIASAIATEQLYRKLDFRLNITAATGAPVDGGVVRLIRRRGDGTNQAPVPTSTYQKDSVGAFRCKASTTGFYYLDGVENIDENDTFYAYNELGGTNATLSVDVRGRE